MFMCWGGWIWHLLKMVCCRCPNSLLPDCSVVMERHCHSFYFNCGMMCLRGRVGGASALTPSLIVVVAMGSHYLCFCCGCCMMFMCWGGWIWHLLKMVCCRCPSPIPGRLSCRDGKPLSSFLFQLLHDVFEGKGRRCRCHYSLVDCSCRDVKPLCWRGLTWHLLEMVCCWCPSPIPGWLLFVQRLLSHNNCLLFWGWISIQCWCTHEWYSLKGRGGIAEMKLFVWGECISL